MKVNILAKPHPYIFFTLQLDMHGVFLKCTSLHNLDWQFMAVASFPPHFPVSQATFLAPPTWPGKFANLHCCVVSVLRLLFSSSHMAWERDYKSTTLTAVALFSGHFLPPPMWPGNKATSPPTFSTLASFSGNFLAPPTWERGLYDPATH